MSHRTGDALLGLFALCVLIAGVLLAGPLAALAALGIVAAGLGAAVLVVSAWRRSAWVAIIILSLNVLDRPLFSLLRETGLGQVATYTDDASLAVAFVLLLLAPRVKLPKLPTAAWLWFFVFAISGLTGAIAFRHNPDGLVLGTWLGLKLPITVYVMVSLEWTRRTVRHLLIVLGGLFILHAAVMAVEIVAPRAVQSYFGDAGSSAMRVGLSSLKGIFAQPVQAATFALFVATVAFCAPVGRGFRRFGYPSLGAALLGLRVKTLADAVVLFACRLAFGRSSATRMLTPVLVVGFACAVFVAASDLILDRFGSVVGSDQSGRRQLLGASFAIAGNHLPVGSGFGTFASEASRAVYSPLWGEYGLAGQYGFREGQAIFATDSSWATVIAENGYLGALAMVAALAVIVLQMARLARRRAGVSWPLAATAFGLIVMVESIASPRLYDGFAAAAWGVLLALALQQARAESTSPDELRTGRLTSATMHAPDGQALSQSRRRTS